jgi:GNAT superfamily N-acetyltransferase
MPEGVEVVEVGEGDERFAAVVALARQVLDQERYLRSEHPEADESHVVGAFVGGRAVGFLRVLVQAIGADVGRPPLTHGGRVLTEGYVEAFGVAPDVRRRGVGTALQEWAADRCRAAGCYQMRSRSPVASTENYELKLRAGYTAHPSTSDDSYYFTRKL